MSIANQVQDNVVGEQKHMVCQADCSAGRATLVIGIFTDHRAAIRAVHDLHHSPARCFRLLSKYDTDDIDPSLPPAAVEPDQFLRRALTIDDQATLASPSSITVVADGVMERRLASLRVYRQVAAQLAAGSDVVVVHAHGSSQQFTAARILLQSRCDVLLTHDGNYGAE